MRVEQARVSAALWVVAARSGECYYSPPPCCGGDQPGARPLRDLAEPLEQDYLPDGTPLPAPEAEVI